MPTPVPINELNRAAEQQPAQPIRYNRSTDHIVLNGDGILCQHCSEQVNYTLPIRLSVWTALINAFIDAHRDCSSAGGKESVFRV